MASLTDDEFTVLSIAAQGERMIPIGRWEQSIRSLAAKGLLHANDSVNYVITDAGREAVAQRDKDDEGALRQLLEVGTKVQNAQKQMEMSLEQASLHLSFAVKASMQLSGEDLQWAVAKGHAQVLQRCLELLANG